MSNQIPNSPFKKVPIRAINMRNREKLMTEMCEDIAVSITI